MDKKEMMHYFSLAAGQVKLASTWGVPLPIVGAGYVDGNIGIDQQNNGKYRKNTTVCGLFALLIPIFFTINEEVQFQRIATQLEAISPQKVNDKLIVEIKAP
jgi:hypothetical protein